MIYPSKIDYLTAENIKKLKNISKEVFLISAYNTLMEPILNWYDGPCDGFCKDKKTNEIFYFNWYTTKDELTGDKGDGGIRDNSEVRVFVVFKINQLTQCIIDKNLEISDIINKLTNEIKCEKNSNAYLDIRYAIYDLFPTLDLDFGIQKEDVIGYIIENEVKYEPNS